MIAKETLAKKEWTSSRTLRASLSAVSARNKYSRNDRQGNSRKDGMDFIADSACISLRVLREK